MGQEVDLVLVENGDVEPIGGPVSSWLRRNAVLQVSIVVGGGVLSKVAADATDNGHFSKVASPGRGVEVTDLGAQHWLLVLAGGLVCVGATYRLLFVVCRCETRAKCRFGVSLSQSRKAQSTTERHGDTATLQQIHTVTQLHSYTATQLHNYTTTQLHNYTPERQHTATWPLTAFAEEAPDPSSMPH